MEQQQRLVVEAIGATPSRNGAWIIANSLEALEAWRHAVWNIYGAVSQFLRTKASLLIFPTVEIPQQAGEIFNDTYLLTLGSLPARFLGVCLVNEAFIEKYIDKKKGVMAQCQQLLCLDSTLIGKIYESTPTLLVGIATEEKELGGEDLEILA